MKISVIAFTALFFSLSIISGCTKIKNQTGLPSVETVSTLHDLLKTPVFEMPDGAKFHLGIDGTRVNAEGYISFYCLLIQEGNTKSDLIKSNDLCGFLFGPVSVVERKPSEGKRIGMIETDYDINGTPPFLYSGVIPVVQDKTYIFDVHYFNKIITSLTIYGHEPSQPTFYKFQIRDQLLCLDYPAVPQLKSLLSTNKINKKQFLKTLYFENNKKLALKIDKTKVYLSYYKPIFENDDSGLLIKVSINGKDCGQTPEPLYTCQVGRASTMLKHSMQFHINWGKSLYGVNDGDKITVQFVYAPSGEEYLPIKDESKAISSNKYLSLDDSHIIYSNKYTFTYRDEDYKIYKPKREKPEKE